MLGQGEHYILSVRGESMIGAGIMDGDYVVVRRQNTAYNGDIVIAMIEDEATVKRFYKEKGVFRLQPENPCMSPIIVPEVTILGKVVSLYRIFLRWFIIHIMGVLGVSWWEQGLRLLLAFLSAVSLVLSASAKTVQPVCARMCWYAWALPSSPLWKA